MVNNFNKFTIIFKNVSCHFDLCQLKNDFTYINVIYSQGFSVFGVTFDTSLPRLDLHFEYITNNMARKNELILSFTSKSKTLETVKDTIHLSVVL